MDLQEVMQQKVFAVVGDTLKEEKYAYKIKKELIEHGYQAYGVGKELLSLNDVPEEIDVIDLCINPIRGLELMKECKKPFNTIVIQPGAGDEALFSYLQKENIPYMEGCVLVGLRVYGK
ncbi:CoA-binding protein [Anaerosporobacter faecicola]|uniref:CoA-binding protein n=1 Tax=Anaerosporobacter faecicola TaxID=2718714 RepID=UPI00143B5C34|nr:CoA-binding protein [Anaerosporobacter faecicola]